MKIALLGSAPSSLRLAPLNNPDWLKWGCSPGVYGFLRAPDAWFELHRWEPGQPWFSPEYCQWMAALKVPVFMAEKIPAVPTSQVLDIPYLVNKYSPYFFTSSLAYMMAMAIEMITGQEGFKPNNGDAIGLWGVDMAAANEEYGQQRAGCQYFALVAQALGIEVGVAPESCLFVPTALYGVSEIEHGQIKLLARRRELAQRLAEANGRANQVSGEINFLNGALEDLDYMKLTWTDQGNYTAPLPAEIMKTIWRPEPAPDASAGLDPLTLDEMFGKPAPKIKPKRPKPTTKVWK